MNDGYQPEARTLVLATLGAVACFAVGFAAARSAEPQRAREPAHGPQIFVDPAKVRLLPDASLHLGPYDGGLP